MKKVIKTDKAPAPIGPYNQAIQAGPFLFCSGQIAIDPSTGKMVDSSLEEEAHQVMKNIKAILDEAAYSFGEVVKTSIFLDSMDNFAKVNEIYGSYFEGDYPARETVAVKTLPKSVRVEISVTLYKE
ncbi:MAG: RidA family protein [Bacteroidia bacterium]|nr:RidA family protein [Bacteroidia bacterium]